MRTHGPDLSDLTAAERAVVLTAGLGSTDSRISRIPPAERGTASKAAIKRARKSVDDLRAVRAALRMPPTTTVVDRHRARLAQAIDLDLVLLVDPPTAGRTVTVRTGEPAVECRLADSGIKYGGRWSQKSMSRADYTVTLGPGRTSALRTAGLRSGAVDGRLILSAHPLHTDDRLTVLACIFAERHGRYGFRVVEDTRRGHVGQRLSYLAVWRGIGIVEGQWYKTQAAALESRPLSSAIREALASPPALTTADDSALAMVAA